MSAIKHIVASGECEKYSADRIYSYVSPYGETGVTASYYGYLGVNNHFIDRTVGIDQNNMTFTAPKRGFWQLNAVGHGSEFSSAGRIITVINTKPAAIDPLLPESTTYEVSDYSTVAGFANDNMTVFSGIVQMAVGDKIQFKGHPTQSFGLRMWRYMYFTGSYVGVWVLSLKITHFTIIIFISYSPFTI